MDFKQSLRKLSGLRASAVNPILKTAHRRDAENAEVARKELPGMVRFLRAGGIVLLVAVFLILSASDNSHSQSGRQKPANANANDNTRPRQVSKPKNSNSSTTQPANAPAASKSDAEQGKGEETTDIVRVSSNLVPVPATVVDARGHCARKFEPGAGAGHGG